MCAHIGFTPQYEHALGGSRVQGRSDAAAPVLADAKAVQEAGAFAVLIEMVPADLGAELTAAREVPTFGLNTGRLSRFVKQYADLHAVLLDAARTSAGEVKDGTFPGPEHTF